MSRISRRSGIARSGRGLIALSGSAALVGSGTLATATIPRSASSPTLLGTGVLSGAVASQPASAPALLGTGSLATSTTSGFTSGAALLGTGSLSGVIAPQFTSGPGLVGAGTLSDVVAPQFISGPGLVGTGALAAVGSVPVSNGPATLLVTGNGSFASGWNAEGVPNYPLVQTNDGAATKIYSPTQGDVVTYTMAQLPAAMTTVSTVEVHVVVTKLDPVFAAVRAVLSIAGTKHDESADFSASTVGVYQDFGQIWYTNPETGANWTVGDVNSLQIGIEKTNPPGVRCTQIYAIVSP